MLILKDNSIKEWAYKRAMTIVAYSDFSPIPVPFNIIYTLSYAVANNYCKNSKNPKSQVRDECVFYKDNHKAMRIN